MCHTVGMNWRTYRARVHVSWLIAAGCLGVIVGVVALPYITRGLFASNVWFLVGVGLVLVALWRQRAYALPIMLIAGSLIGMWRGSITQYQLEPYSRLVGQQVMVVGKVSEDSDLGRQNELILRLHVNTINSHEIGGSIWISTPTQADIKRGDIVTAQGVMAEGFGGFNGSMYRAAIVKVQRPQPGDVARQVRDEFADTVRETIPEPQASLGIGYLVGQRRALPPELEEALRIAGLTHIVVASGYNLTILVRLARRLFMKISKYAAALSAGSMIAAFIAVTGMSPSMSRAGLVAGLSLLAWYYGRKVHPLVLLPLAAAVTLLVNPSYGWNDLGWQLSFAAFAGVMILAPLLQRYLFGDKKPGTIRQILGETISAQIVTLPILIVAFGYYSNVAIMANLLILPLVPLAMLLTFIAGIGTLFIPAAVAFIGLPATWLLQYMTATAQYFAGLPWAQTELAVGAIAAWVYYAALVGVCVYMWRITKYNLRDTNIVE